MLHIQYLHRRKVRGEIEQEIPIPDQQKLDLTQATVQFGEPKKKLSEQNFTDTCELIAQIGKVLIRSSSSRNKYFIHHTLC